MAINSKRKGNRGEVELSNVLREYGFDTRRGQQYSGANGDADVVGIEGLHIECKRVEQLNIDKALQQSIRDARPFEFPIVAHRKNYEDWKVTMRLEDFIAIWKIYKEASGEPV